MSENFEEILKKAMGRVLGNKSAEKEKKTVREGEETLKKTLKKMYEKYKNSVSPKPDYEQKYGSAAIEMPELPNYRADDALKKEADAAAADAYREKREEAERVNNEVSGDAAERKKTAEETYRERLKTAEARAARAKADVEAKIAAQGLSNSTIAEGLRMRAAQTLESEKKRAEEKYRSAIAGADLKITAAEEKLAGALKTFGIAEAAKAEKELKSLKKERESALKSYADEYNASVRAAEKAEQEKNAAILNDEAARDEAFRERIEANGGAAYEGAEAAEMENRYRVAESFYKSIPNDKAKNLIMNSAEELKFLLGNHYERLLKTLNIL